MSKQLSHIGVARRSGRYPYGSGKNPEQRNTSFSGRIKELKKQGLSELEISKGMGLTSKELRSRISLAKTEQVRADAAQAQKLRDKGLSWVAIGELMNRNESSVRSLLNPKSKLRSTINETISNKLKEAVDSKTYIDVGIGVERQLGISRTRLQTVLTKLKDEGYKLHYSSVDQLGTGKKTSLLILTKDTVTGKEVYRDRDKIRLVDAYSNDGGINFINMQPPKPIALNRVGIRYGDQGGSLKDGVIELRRGVPDISLGTSNYAQVRIAVTGDSYMKGMAIYNDSIPKGFDVIYNTNKPKGTPAKSVFKPLKDDIDNPFGAIVRQKEYLDSNGKRQLSVLNIVNEEGDWSKWTRSISSQMLSKQSPELARTQLGISYDSRKEEFDMINKLTNKTVKKLLLEAFADGSDSAAVHLKAAAMPRQASPVLLPFSSIKETEVFAPNFKNGEKVVLIRYPHGGIFEIPELRVNNKNADAKKVIGQATDAIGINPKVAEKLSGADFDGDTVLIIPNDKGLIKTSPSLLGLKDFEPRIQYAKHDGMRVMDTKTTAMQMGLISNLITDMSIKRAPTVNIAQAVRHSMVVIDAQKHELDYMQSYRDNNIARLKVKYQGSGRGGAATIISRASSPLDVRDRKTYIDKLTGEKTYVYTGKSYINKDGKEIFKTTKSTKLAEETDAYKLIGAPDETGKLREIEVVYANHSNKLKALANEARKVGINIKEPPASVSAKKVYVKEVDSLDAKLNLALLNSPLERHSQLLANSTFKSKLSNRPGMSGEDKKKLKSQELSRARATINPKGKQVIDITTTEWEAIQAGAISPSKLKQILNNTDMEKVKSYSMPRENLELSSPQTKRVKVLLGSGYTQSEIAEQLFISTAAVNKVANKKGS